MPRPMTKKQLSAELAHAAGLSSRDATAFLDSLVKVAYREATNGFRIPGLLKMDVVTRKPRRCRHPRTGEMLAIAERNAVRIRPLKKASDAIAPAPANLVSRMEPDAATQPAQPAPAMESVVTFSCPGCERELEAPATAAGNEVACPMCGNEFAVPSSDSTVVSETPVRIDFVTFNCGGCGHELEAPVELAGVSGECPGCNAQIRVPTGMPPRQASDMSLTAEQARQLNKKTIRIELPTLNRSADIKSSTIRIDLPDLRVSA